MPLSRQEIEAIVNAALKKALPKLRVDKVVVDVGDVYLDPSVEIVVIVSRGKSVSLSGSQLAAVQEEVQTALLAQGDQRFPIIRYRTVSEARKSPA